MKNKIYQFLIKKGKSKNSSIIFGKNSKINRNSFFEGKNSIGNNSVFFNSRIGFGSYISGGCKFDKIKIGKFCSIGQNVKNGIGRHPSSTFVSTHPAFFSLKKQAGFTFIKSSQFEEHLYVDEECAFYSIIGNDVWIGNDVTIFDGVNIGDGAIVANGAIVTKNVEPYSIVGGIPAKEIKKRFEISEIDFLIELKWWEKNYEWIEENSHLFSDIKLFLKKLKN